MMFIDYYRFALMIMYVYIYIDRYPFQIDLNTANKGSGHTSLCFRKLLCSQGCGIVHGKLLGEGLDMGTSVPNDNCKMVPSCVGRIQSSCKEKDT